MPKLCSLAAVLAGAIVCVIGAASQNEKEVSPPAVALLSEFRSDEVRDLVKKHLAALHERDVKRAREAADVFFDLRGGTDLLVQVVEFPNFDVKSHATQLLRQLAKPGDVRLTAGLVPHVRRASDISGGGAEVLIAKRKFTKELLGLLGYLTSQEFGRVDTEDAQQLERVAAQCEKWLKEHRE